MLPIRHASVPTQVAARTVAPMGTHESHDRQPHDHQPHEHGHGHGHVRLDEADWAAMAATAELEGELFLGYVTDTTRWITELRGPGAPPVRRVLDIGSGPGVGTCELARRFPDAHVVAVDGSPAMLERARQRALALGLDPRVTTHLAELPGGLDGLDPVDVIWASMSLHHVGDETAALAALRGALAPTGLLAIAEVAEPMRVLPDRLDVGRPGLGARIDEAEAEWFASMRAGLDGSVPSDDLAAMVAAAGFDVVGSRLARQRVDPPLAPDARQVAVSRIHRARQQLAGRIHPDDDEALAVLGDADDPRSVLHRPDVFVASSRRIVLARPRPRPPA